MKKINVALQGGGSHGAYTWGVLDRLLADERIEIEAVSGTSAGAMNAVVMAEGLVEGGRHKARQQLQEFWHRVAYRVPSSMAQGWGNDWTAAWEKAWSFDKDAAASVAGWWSQFASPYQFNPLNINPLRDILLGEVDFDRVRRCNKMQLFISATNVRTGQIKIFTGDEVTADAVLASACLPNVFHAVEIGADAYWDGGYMGNPTIEPFFKSCASSDVVLVQINPIMRDEVPRNPQDIANRVNEISFNAPLLRELRHVEFVNNRLRDGDLTHSGYREIFLHRVGGGADLSLYPASSKLDGDMTLIDSLHDLGFSAMDAWLEKNFHQLGVASTMPLEMARG